MVDAELDVKVALAILTNSARLHKIGSQALFNACLIIAAHRLRNETREKFQELALHLFDNHKDNLVAVEEIEDVLDQEAFGRDLSTFCASRGKNMVDTFYVLTEIMFRPAARRASIDQCERRLIGSIRDIAELARSAGKSIS